MINWRDDKSGAIDGESDAKDWKSAQADIVSTLGLVCAEMKRLRAPTAYVEMWPDSGRFIAYPAKRPVDLTLADRECRFVIQLRFAFWAEAWDGIHANSRNSEKRYEQMTIEAVEALADASRNCEAFLDLIAADSTFCLYAFEYEGSEGLYIIGRNEL